LVVLCAGFTLLLGEDTPTSSCIWRPCPECNEASKHHLLKFGFLLLVRLNLGFTTEGRLATVLIIPSSWGSQRAVIASHQWCIVSHATYDRLLGSHLVLKRLTEPKEFPALDEEMCGFSPSVFIDISVPGAPPVEYFFRRKRWLITTPAPLHFWPQIVASASTIASVVIVPLP
jgi:hypothetical protein